MPDEHSPVRRTIPPSGSRYKGTDDGGVHSKPILFVFGGDYAPAFAAAKRRSAATRGGDRWRHDESPSIGSAFLFPSLQWNDIWVAARHLAPWIYRPGRATRCI
jgi:hypothetical protein